MIYIITTFSLTNLTTRTTSMCKIDWFDLLYSFSDSGWRHKSRNMAQGQKQVSNLRDICTLWVIAAAAAKSLQSCPTPSDPMDCSPPGSSVHGIFQARVLEWGAIAFSLWVIGSWQFWTFSLPLSHNTKLFLATDIGCCVLWIAQPEFQWAFFFSC